MISGDMVTMERKRTSLFVDISDYAKDGRLAEPSDGIAYAVRIRLFYIFFCSTIQNFKVFSWVISRGISDSWWLNQFFLYGRIWRNESLPKGSM